jgi:GTP pyrophosphokinase
LIIGANDRQGLLRDMSEVLIRERINVTATRTQSRGGMARMHLTIEVPGRAALQRAIKMLGEIAGVIEVRRA